MNSKALSAEAEISKILDDSIIMIYPATQELSREHFMTNWPDDQPSNKDMGYAFVGRVAACSASVPAPARTVSSVKKYRQAKCNRYLVRFQAIKEATALLEDDVEPGEQERALRSNIFKTKSVGFGFDPTVNPPRNSWLDAVFIIPFSGSILSATIN